MRVKDVVVSGPAQRDRDEGSALMLVPAGFLVLMLLAALTVDSAVAFLGQRQLNDALSAAANDAATAGLSDTSFYQSGSVTLDPSSAATAVCRSLAAQDDAGLHDLHVAVGVSGGEVVIRGTARVDAVFGRTVPGFATREVSAEATADAQSGPAQDTETPPVLQPVDCS